MILFILLALLIAAIRGKRVTGLLRERSLYPLWVLEIVFWIFQISAWMGDSRFIPYGALLQTACMLSLLWPILRHRLYPQAIAGALLSCAGTALNRLAMRANGGRMPVYPTLSRLTGYYRDGALEAAEDALHVLMTPDTHLNFLADVFDVGFSIMSVGDLLIHAFVTLVVYGVVVRLN